MQTSLDIKGERGHGDKRTSRRTGSHWSVQEIKSRAVSAPGHTSSIRGLEDETELVLKAGTRVTGASFKVKIHKTDQVVRFLSGNV